MAKEVVRIQKESYNSNQYKNFVDREFTTFVDPTPVVDTDTVEELFRLYDKLYYVIPIEGEDNSHQYLLQRSSEITDFEKNTQDIQPLLDEIAILREQILEYQQQLIEANTPE